MTKEERRVKKYIDAWCEEKRVQYFGQPWIDVKDIFTLLRAFHNGYPLRIVKGKRV